MGVPILIIVRNLRLKMEVDSRTSHRLSLAVVGTITSTSGVIPALFLIAEIVKFPDRFPIIGLAELGVLCLIATGCCVKWLEREPTASKAK